MVENKDKYWHGLCQIKIAHDRLRFSKSQQSFFFSTGQVIQTTSLHSMFNTFNQSMAMGIEQEHRRLSIRTLPCLMLPV